MTPMSAPMAGAEQILLLVFVLMLFACIAGGNPSMVLKPLFEIVAQIVMALISLLSSLLMVLLRVASSVLVSGVKVVSDTLRSGSVTQNKR